MKFIKYGTIATIGLISVSILGNNEAIAAEKAVNSGGLVEFKADETIKPPVSPDGQVLDLWDATTANHEPAPGTTGPLSLDFVSSLDFGQNQISNEDVVIQANPQYEFKDADRKTSEKDPKKKHSNFVQITDARGTNAGWTLRVKQNGQFKNEKALNKTLTGATIRYKDGLHKSTTTGVVANVQGTFDLVPDGSGEAAIVMSAKATQGSGRHQAVYGVVKDDKNTGVELLIPGSTAKDAVSYKTSLTWTLSDVPAAADTPVTK